MSSRCIFYGTHFINIHDEYERCRSDFFCLLQASAINIHFIDIADTAAAAAAMTLGVTVKHFSRVIGNSCEFILFFRFVFAATANVAEQSKCCQLYNIQIY